MKEEKQNEGQRGEKRKWDERVWEEGKGVDGAELKQGPTAG